MFVGDTMTQETEDYIQSKLERIDELEQRVDELLKKEVEQKHRIEVLEAALRDITQVGFHGIRMTFLGLYDECREIARRALEGKE
jgi:hypothetical protein